MSGRPSPLKEAQKFIYSGSSMAPTFRPGQGLYVHPDVRDLQPGDVVIYRQSGRHVVHRVVSVGVDGYRTRGDNNRLTDPALVDPSLVVGRVERVAGNGDDRSVLNGGCGLWRARLGWLFMFVEQPLRVVLGWPYRLLKSSRLMRCLWKPAILQVHLQTGNGSLVKFLYQGRTVAVWEPGIGRFLCRKPFDLVLFPPAVTSLDPTGSERSDPSCKPGSAS